VLCTSPEKYFCFCYSSSITFYLREELIDPRSNKGVVKSVTLQFEEDERFD